MSLAAALEALVAVPAPDLTRARDTLGDVCARAGVPAPPVRFREDEYAALARTGDGFEVVLGPQALGLPDAQLAAVLAHEVGHLARRHHQRFGRAVAVLIAVAVVAAVAETWACFAEVAWVNVVAALSLMCLANPWLMPWLSRRHEREADDFAARLGYVQASIDELEGAGHDHEREMAESWLWRTTSTHPPVAERIAAFRRHL